MEIPFKHACPHCGRKQDVVYGVTIGRYIAPTPGSLGICFDCGGVFEFRSGGKTVPHSNEAEWPPELITARNMVLDYHIHNGQSRLRISSARLSRTS